jgi:hypothetical protein
MKGKKKPKQYSESVSDLIAAGLLKPETVLQPLRKNVAATARVLLDGKLEVDGVEYGSLSGAAKAAAGTVAEAGWDFWGAPSGTGGHVPLAELRERLREEGANGKPQPPAAVKLESKTSPTAVKVPALAPAAAARSGLFPMTIFADYRGAHIEGAVDEHGLIHLGDDTFTSPSMAAVAARKAHGYSGSGKAATNGWTFWRFTDSDGTTKPLDALRTPSA